MSFLKNIDGIEMNVVTFPSNHYDKEESLLDVITDYRMSVKDDKPVLDIDITEGSTIVSINGYGESEGIYCVQVDIVSVNNIEYVLEWYIKSFEMFELDTKTNLNTTTITCNSKSGEQNMSLERKVKEIKQSLNSTVTYPCMQEVDMNTGEIRVLNTKGIQNFFNGDEIDESCYTTTSLNKGNQHEHLA